MGLLNYSFMFYLGTESSDESGSRAFGPGFAELLHGIDEYGSLYSSAKNMNMSYSKAWTILNSVESAYNIKLVERNGQRGSALTEEAYNLLALYDEIVESVNDVIKDKLAAAKSPFNR